MNFLTTSNNFSVGFSAVHLIASFRIRFATSLPQSFWHEKAKEQNGNKRKPHGASQAKNMPEFLNQELADEIGHGCAKSKGRCCESHCKLVTHTGAKFFG